MPYDNRFDRLAELGDELSTEVIRDAETRLQAQLEAANAADQRAMGWAGLLVTIVIALLGGAVTLALAKQHLFLVGVTALYASTVLIAAMKAIDSVRPVAFCFPGNRPFNWLPDNWYTRPGAHNDWVVARREQASDLDNRIQENAKWAEKSGKLLKLSMDWLIFGTIFCSVIAGLVIIFVDH